MMPIIPALLAALAVVSPHPAAVDPHALVSEAVAAMGIGRKPVGTLRLVGIQHEFMLGNAERAEGPWRAFYSHFSELRDVGATRLRRTDHAFRADGSEAPERIIVLSDSVLASWSGGRETGASRGTFEDWIDRVELSPDRALRLAASSAQLRLLRTGTRYGVQYDLVELPWRNGTMRIELSRETHLPIAIEAVRPYPDNFRWAPFGDVTMRTDYLDWQLQPWGGWWPMQQQVSFNGQPLRDVTLAKTALDSMPAEADSFVVSDSARAQFTAASRMNFATFRLGMRGQPTELRPGIVRVPDFWSMTLVKQADGVMIFEAHISAQYLHDVIDEAHRRWPGAPIKGIVMTSDPWAHLGGFREAIALGIPIYVNARSIPFLTALARSPHHIQPDAQQREGRTPKFIPITGKTVVGSGDTRFELYPVGGAYAERMVMAYFPADRLLYGADLVAPTNGPASAHPVFDETEASDLRAAVSREHLSVDSVFCVQNFPHPYSWKVFAPDQKSR